MLWQYKIIRQAARRIGEAVNQTVESFAEGRIRQEPDFTSRMVQSIENAIDGFEKSGILWRAMVLSDRGRNAQEHIYGADFMGVLHIHLPDFQVTKGFLAQSKIIRPNMDVQELHYQCERMLNLSQDSFVFLYSVEGVRIVPAVSVVGTDLDPRWLYSRSVQRFFEEHFESFIGDRNISDSQAITLERLREKYKARTLISITAKMGWE